MADLTTDNREKLWDLIKDIRFAMLTTRHQNGHLHSRPMTTQNRKMDQDDVLWFFMARDSETMADLQRDPNVNIAYANPDDDRYISVSGDARVRDDAQRKRELWSAAAKAWFPGGVDDPQLALVEVAITHADYWDVRDSKFVQLIKHAGAAISGKPPTDMAEHGQVRMR